MSDLCIHKFEDIVWDDFYLGDDPMMLPRSQQSEDHSISGSPKKRRRPKNNYYSSCVDNADEWSFLSLSKRRNIMSEKDSWSHLQSELFPSSVNSASSPQAFEVDDAEKGDDEFCVNGSIISGMANAVDKNSFSYTLDDITDPVDNLEYFANTECKNASDLLYYGWPEIGNFDDVDRMFRSCDSTFGVGSSKEVDPGLLTTVFNAGGSGELVKSGFEFPHPESNKACDVLVNHDSSKSDSVTGNPLRAAFSRTGDGSMTSEKSDSFMSFVNGPVLGSKDGYFPTQQINEQGTEHNLPKQSAVKGKDEDVKDDGFHYVSSLPSSVIGRTYEAISCQKFQTFVNRHQEEASAPSQCNHLRSSLSVVGSDNICFSSVAEVGPVEAGIQSWDDFNPCSSVDSSLTSCHLKAMGSSHDLSADGQKQMLLSGHSNHSSMKNNALRVAGENLTTKGDSGSIRKQILLPAKKCENQSEAGNAITILPEIGSSSNTQDGSSTNPLVDNVPFEAASFHQLQHVMDTLDTKTKLCIRDSLYRLARSAERRHSYAKQTAHLGDDNETSASFLPGEATSCLVSIERDTNPVDRSVAHLLFHRPVKSSSPDLDHSTLPPNPPGMFHGSASNPDGSIDDPTSESGNTSDSRTRSRPLVSIHHSIKTCC